MLPWGGVCYVHMVYVCVYMISKGSRKCNTYLSMHTWVSYVAPTWSVRELPRCTLSACTSASPTYCHHQPAQHASSEFDQGGPDSDGTTCGDRACVYSQGASFALLSRRGRRDSTYAISI
jgi:hypothetical protein